MARKATKIPTATILRLSIYHRYLQSLQKDGIPVISSAQLADGTNVNPAQLRKDLSYFGRFGVRGVGYDVPKLLNQIKEILGLGKAWDMALIGAGTIGQALLQHHYFKHQGYNFVLVFDNNPARIGKKAANGMIIHSTDELPQKLAETPVDLAVLAVPASSAQKIADMAIGAGIKGILNFTPVRFKVPNHVKLQHVDFTNLLDTLTYALSSKKNEEKQGVLKKEKSWNAHQPWKNPRLNYSNLLVTK